MTSISELNSPILPLELVLRIMDELDLYADKGTFYRLSLVAQSYRLVAQWKLFRAVDLAFFFLFRPREHYWTQDTTNDSTTAKQFLRTITTVPSLARAVKHFKITLHLHYGHKNQPLLYTLSNPLTDILDQLMCLKSLEVDSRSCLNWSWFTGQAKRGIERKLRSCPSLRMISFKGITAIPQSVLAYPINLHTLVLSSTLGVNSLIHHNFRPGQFTALRNLTITWEIQTTIETDMPALLGFVANSSDEASFWKDPKDELSTTELHNVYTFFTSRSCFISLAALTKLSILTWSAHASDIQSLIMLCSKTLEDLSFLAPRECTFYEGVSEDGITPPNFYPPVNLIDLSSIINLSRLRITARFEWDPMLSPDDQPPIYKSSPLLWLGAVLQTLPDNAFGVPTYIELRLAFENLSFTSESFILPWSNIVEPLLSRLRHGSDDIVVKLKCLRLIGELAETVWLTWVESLKRDRAALKWLASSVVADSFAEIDVDEPWREQAARRID